MPSTVENALHEAFEAPLGSRRSRRPSIASKSCTLTTHDEGFSKKTVLVSPELFTPSLGQDIILQITSVKESPSASSSRKSSHRSALRHGSAPQFVFALEAVEKDVLANYPSLEVSLLQPIANALGFTNRSKVLVSDVDRDEHLASHVEIAFKDAFLTRADMWRLLTSDLIGTSIYKNQKVLFINSVRANVKAIYAGGRRVQSALLDASTKAIFRSNSSRYYILLQMSREMWDFDADGGGEIYFNKVINGFLPELFRRWESLGTSHSVSVVLFTRMEYDSHPDGLIHQDHYRVLTTELLSSESAMILHRLKEEFKTFLRDVTIQHGDQEDAHGANGVIRGRPAPAIHGNILQAIHTAALQFLRSNATCDLRRTGLSLIVITPGTGVFEVDHELLVKTTDVLIDNGIYIDLVCLAKTPLHSSPLFRYRDKTTLQTPNAVQPTEDWEYTMPHWVDVSFWQSLPTSDIDILANHRESKRMSNLKKFVPRVRMYEIQMTGIMQNEFSIALPRLPCPHSVRFPTSFGLNTKAFKPRASLESYDLEGSKAVYNQGYKENGHSGSPEKSPSQSHLQPFTEIMNWMEDYDEACFKPQNAGQRASSEAQVRQTGSHSPELKPLSDKATVQSSRDAAIINSKEEIMTVLPRRKNSTASTASKFRASSGKFNPLARHFGPGFKGFGAAKATATTFVSADAVASVAPELVVSSRPSSQVEHHFPDSSALSRPSTRASAISSVRLGVDLSEEQAAKSKPIDIKPVAKKQSLAEVRDERELAKVEPERPIHGDGVHPKEVSKAPSAAALKSRDLKSPWMTMLNPSNPTQLSADMTSRLGRWQHVFPKPTQVSTIKWKSLCSPACLPLTTEDFPSHEQLKTEYARSDYEVKVSKVKEGDETEAFGEWLIRELIASRLTRSFSVVVGTRPAQALGLPKAQRYEFLHEKGMGKPGVKIIMSRGTEIHELCNVKNGIVKVTRYIRIENHNLHNRHEEYSPMIKTAYAKNYTRRTLSFLSRAPKLDWERLDNFVSCEEEELNKPYPDEVQYWQARFVLIPIAVSGARKRNHSPEDNEEEIRLEGIRKLTQMWQRNRYVPSDQRRYESKIRKDLNPLDIVYRTQPASVIVSEEMKDTLLEDGADQKPTLLLPEKELFERVKFSMSALAKALQGDKGVPMNDRRWHWRLHHNCFIGIDLVTWLTNNFRDIDTREEAVEFGNQLMMDGLFVHVERRHNFREGNFFYQITEKYRIRTDVRSSWFGRLADRSVPATPVAGDAQGEETKKLGAQTSPSNEAATMDRSADENEGTASRDKGRSPVASVMLSKQLVYDMDHRKKSNRRELVNLHVDRVSSADDCYHVRIDWVTATPKLIEDTVESWATTAERSGLRLVELPLLEARRFTELHPFRHPYYIKLAREPPAQPPHAAASSTPSTTSHHSSSNNSPSLPGAVSPADPQPNLLQQSRWPYHKAILKKFDFVLDVESAQDFPDDVDVRYSWGVPDYRLPQYITRSGRLLVQITNDGRFLLLINQLYNGRGAVAREAQRTAAGAAGTGSIHAPPARPGLTESLLELSQPIPRRTPITPGPASTGGLSKLSTSPFASPMLRAATTAAAAADASANPTPPLQANFANMAGSINGPPSFAASMLSPVTQQASQPSPPSPPLSKSELLTVTELRIELEAFCSDPVALEKFYDEELHRPVATVPSTPVVRPTSTLPGIEETVGLGAQPPAFSLGDEVVKEDDA